jgi:uncharacterized membrane protein YedE/YeeE
MVKLVESEDWIFGTRIAAILLSVGFASAAFLANRTQERWPLGFLIVIGGVFGVLLKMGFDGFTVSFKHIFELEFIAPMHLFLMITLSALLISIVHHSAGDSFRPLFQQPSPPNFTLPGRPVGVSTFLGSFVFGAGMQLSSGCSAGTLVNLGSGVVKSVIVFIFFIVGATVGVQDGFYRWWRALPAKDSVQIDWYITVAITLALFLACAIVEFVRYKRAPLLPPGASFTLQDAQGMLLDGYDPTVEARHQPGYLLKRIHLYGVDALLAVTVTLWFVCVGRTIDVVGGVAHFGSRIVGIFGPDPVNWAFWKDTGIADNLMRDPTFLSDISILLGALIGAAAAGKFAVDQENEVIPLIKGAFGGFLLGIGGIVGGGCSIGGFLSGMCASAPSAFVWLGSALLGSGVVIGAEALYRRFFARPAFMAFEVEK